MGLELTKTYDKRNAVVVGNLGNGLEIGNEVVWITDALNIDGLGVLVDGGSKILWLDALDELGLDVEAREEHAELVVCATIQM